MPSKLEQLRKEQQRLDRAEAKRSRALKYRDAVTQFRNEVTEGNPVELEEDASSLMLDTSDRSDAMALLMDIANAAKSSAASPNFDMRYYFPSALRNLKETARLSRSLPYLARRSFGHAVEDVNRGLGGLMMYLGQVPFNTAYRLKQQSEGRKDFARRAADMEAVPFLFSPQKERERVGELGIQRIRRMIQEKLGRERSERELLKKEREFDLGLGHRKLLRKPG